jgi:TolB-like protein
MTLPEAPTGEEVRAQLDRILGHRDFEASDRIRELLRFVVEEDLAGRTERLKGYTIAVEVFGRPPDFDANLDPIVRIQAGRLRRALEHYYLVAGGNDPVVISIPKGGYVPACTRPSRVTPSSDASIFDAVAELPLGVAVAVLPFRELAPESGDSFFAQGLTDEVCSELSRYQDLCVIPCRQGLALADDADLPQDLARKLGARFLLEGSVRRETDRAKISVRLVDGAQGMQVWAQGYGLPLSPDGLIAVQETIAIDVSAALGDAYGVISQHLAIGARRVAPAEMKTYEALLLFHDHSISLDPAVGADCLVALHAAVEREPDYGPLWAALSLLVGRAYLMDAPGLPNAKSLMADYARKAATLAPANQLARAAMGYCHFLLKEREAFEREMAATLELNPGSPYFTGAVGYLLILAGDSRRGRPLLNRGIARNPCHPGWFNHGLCVDAYMRGDYEGARQETLKPGFDVHVWGPMLRAAVFGRLGRTEEAAGAASELLQVVPNFESRARDLTSRAILSEAIVDALLDGLRKAGLNLKDA